jgi:PAS domain S-box-containing protein
MTDFFKRVLDSDFAPHGQALVGQPEILWIHVISDALIALAYFLILIALTSLVKKRPDLSPRGTFALFGFFLFACAVTHLMEIWSVWHGTFRLFGMIKAITGVAGIATAVLLLKAIPDALSLPSIEELNLARSMLESEQTDRERERLSWTGDREGLRREIDTGARELQMARTALADDQAMTRRLHELELRLLVPRDLRPLGHEVVTSMIELQKADMGSLQLSDAETGTLEVLAHHGFEQNVREKLRDISSSNPIWNETLRRGNSVVVEDVLADAAFEPHWAVAAAAGFRAMQLTPLIGQDKEFVGVVSTHFRLQLQPSERDTRYARLYAEKAAETIERQRILTAQSERDLRLRQLIGGLNELGLFMLDPAGKVVSWNKGAERIAEREASEILGRHFSLLFEPQEREAEKAGEAMRRAVAEGRFEEQVSGVRKNGVRYWSNLILTPLNDDAGDLQGFAGAMLDVTEQKQAADELRSSAAHLAEAEKLSHTGSWGWNVDSGEVYWSQETFRIFGVNPGDVKPSYQLFLQFVHPEDRVLVEQTLEKAKSETSDFKMEFRIVLSDGSTRQLRSIGHPAQDKSLLAEFSGAVIDITEQKVTEKVFRNVQAEFARVARLTIEEYASSMVREIDESLEAIAKNGDFCFRLAEATRALPFESREPLLNIIKDAAHAKEILGRARESVRQSSREVTPLEPGDLLLDVLALASRDLRQHRITVRTEFAEDLPNVSGDRIELQQALFNVIINAIEAMTAETDDKRILTVRTARDTLEGKGAVRIDVEDRGVGFDPAQKGRLFDPFYSTKPKSMGMGLRISRSIVEAHGGRLSASANADSGATFTCVLPAAEGSVGGTR